MQVSTDGLEHLFKNERERQKTRPGIEPKRPTVRTMRVRDLPEVELTPDKGVFLEKRDGTPRKRETDGGAQTTDTGAED
jgi:hypothetical protein